MYVGFGLFFKRASTDRKSAFKLLGMQEKFQLLPSGFLTCKKDAF